MRKTAFALLAATVLVAGCGAGKSATNAAGAKVFASAGCGGGPQLSPGEGGGPTRPHPHPFKPRYHAVLRQGSHGGGGGAPLSPGGHPKQKPDVRKLLSPA